MLEAKLMTSISCKHMLNIHFDMLRKLHEMHVLLIMICFVLTRFIMGLPRLIGISCHYLRIRNLTLGHSLTCLLSLQIFIAHNFNMNVIMFQIKITYNYINYSGTANFYFPLHF